MERIDGMLRALRLQRQLALREVEERSHIFAEERGDCSYRISASWLSLQEQGEHELAVNKLVALAHIYDVQPEQLLGSMYPGSLGCNQPPDETTLLSPAVGPSPGPYKFGIIGKHDRALEPLVPSGSVVRIDTRRRVISANQKWAHELQRPVYFLKTREGYSCCWCEFDPLGESLTLVPHPLSPASRRSWKYPKEVETIGRVVAVTIRFIPSL